MVCLIDCRAFTLLTIIVVDLGWWHFYVSIQWGSGSLRKPLLLLKPADSVRLLGRYHVQELADLEAGLLLALEVGHRAGGLCLHSASGRWSWSDGSSARMVDGRLGLSVIGARPTKSYAPGRWWPEAARVDNVVLVCMVVEAEAMRW